MAAFSLEALLPQLNNPRKSGAGYTARCPAHDDNRNSLSVAEGANGQLLLKCHAGCSFEKVFASLTAANVPRSGRRISVTYRYTDELGNLLFETVRFEPKGFAQRRPDGKGGWIYNLHGVRLVPYRLPELRNADLVFISEGEKDVETLRKLGLVATCNPMGALKWKPEYSEHFRGKTVAILPDNDEAGRAHSERVAAALSAVAAEVLIISLPDLPEKGDVTDFVRHGGNKDDLIGLIERAEAWAPGRKEQVGTSRLTLTRISDLLAQPAEAIRYVWDDTLPAAGISIVSARPKVGKSTLVRNLIVNVARGTPCLGRGTVKGPVLYFCLEEKVEEIKRIFGKMEVKDEDILICTDLKLAQGEAIRELELAIVEHKPALVVIDPLSRMVRIQDFNDYAQATRVMEPFIDLARRTGVHILFTHHDSKTDRTGGEAALGSIGFFGGVDSHLQMKMTEGGGRLITVQRYGEDFPETILEFDRENGTLYVKGTRKEIDRERVRPKILEIVRAIGVAHQAQIKDGITGYSNGQISKELNAMVEEGILRKEGEGKRGDPVRYSLTESLSDFR